jgi:NADH:ubiquinone oxidoreductase subunit 2 (subunit N)
MLHSIDLLTFYISLEAQNFCFIVLSGLPHSFPSLSFYSKVIKGRAQATFYSKGLALQSAQATFYSKGLALQSAQANFYSKGNVFNSSMNKIDERINSNSRNEQEGITGINYVYSVEASLKYFVLSAFSSGVLLFMFSAIYLQTGISIFNFSSYNQSYTSIQNILYSEDYVYTVSVYLILCAMMFKLGAAPLHLWMVQIYGGVKQSLLLYISTAPKLCLLGFWVNSFQTMWTSYSLLFFCLFSIILGSFSAYKEHTLRGLLVYSTINEIGLLLSALETAGFNSLYQHLGIYIVSQLLLWNLYLHARKQLFVVLAVSLAGLPPLAGFFGKAWIFMHLSTVGSYTILTIALICTAISLVYYLRLIFMFWNNTYTYTYIYSYNIYIFKNYAPNRIYLTSTLVVLLFLLPIFVIKPFIL